MHEHADFFKWFFNNWVAMGGVNPIVILTDQYERIRIVVREVMPNIVHQCCVWNIYQKIHLKFKSVVDRKKCSNDQFYSVTYENLNIVEYEGM